MAYQFPNSRIIIFARAPITGRVKTRLIPVLGETGTAKLAEKLLRHTVAMAIQSKLCPVELWCTPDCSHPIFTEMNNTYRISLNIQQGKDLGDRMAHALQTVLSRSSSAILIGTDCPVMSVQHLQQAIQALNSDHDMVVTPVEDGGYVLIGMQQFYPAVFENVQWGTEHVFAQTQCNIISQGLNSFEHETLWDIDTAEDLQRLALSRVLE